MRLRLSVLSAHSFLHVCFILHNHIVLKSKTPFEFSIKKPIENILFVINLCLTLMFLSFLFYHSYVVDHLEIDNLPIHCLVLFNIVSIEKRWNLQLNYIFVETPLCDYQFLLTIIKNKK